jgi:hypothetical protein
VSFQAVPGSATVVAAITFDKGSGHKTVLRRIGKSMTWRGGIVWPVAATSARVEIENPSKAVVPGSVSVGRKSIEALEKDLDVSLAKIVKDYENAKARAEGRDQAETVTLR